MAQHQTASSISSRVAGSGVRQLCNRRGRAGSIASAFQRNLVLLALHHHVVVDSDPVCADDTNDIYTLLLILFARARHSFWRSLLLRHFRHHTFCWIMASGLFDGDQHSMAGHRSAAILLNSDLVLRAGNACWRSLVCAQRCSIYGADLTLLRRILFSQIRSASICAPKSADRFAPQITCRTCWHSRCAETSARRQSREDCCPVSAINTGTPASPATKPDNRGMLRNTEGRYVCICSKMLSYRSGHRPQR